MKHILAAFTIAMQTGTLKKQNILYLQSLHSSLTFKLLKKKKEMIFNLHIAWHQNSTFPKLRKHMLSKNKMISLILIPVIVA